MLFVSFCQMLMVQDDTFFYSFAYFFLEVLFVHFVLF